MLKLRQFQLFLVDIIFYNFDIKCIHYLFITVHIMEYKVTTGPSSIGHFRDLYAYDVNYYINISTTSI